MSRQVFLVFFGEERWRVGDEPQASEPRSMPSRAPTATTVQPSRTSRRG